MLQHERVVPHTVGASRERVRFLKSGVETELSLIAIPVVVSFKEMVPTSHIETALYDFDCAGNCANYLAEVGGYKGQPKFFPQLFLFDQLMAAPISAVKKEVISLHAEIDNARKKWPSWASGERSFKRSSAFLRYLVGCQIAEETQSRNGQLRFCAMLEEIMMRVLERRIGQTCEVDIIDTGSFFESLYAGMWRYQVKRLDYLIRHVWNSTIHKGSLCAKVNLQGQRRQFELRVGFFRGDRPVDGHGYLFRTRPAEDTMRCLQRIKSRIEASGICTIVDDGGEHGTRSVPLQLAVPV